MKELKYAIKTIASLKNMIIEMNEKEIELKRITKTAALLLMSGVSKNSIPQNIVNRCLSQQNQDGGWVGIVDTMWNIYFLRGINDRQFKTNIDLGLKYIEEQRNSEGLWGRSKRDISRIPITGILLYLLPDLADKNSLCLLEKLWQSEKNSLTYKAAYTLMAFKRNIYFPKDNQLIYDTIEWLTRNQREDGGYSPWKEHPVDSDVYCTSLASIGLLQYPKLVEPQIFQKAFNWLLNNQLNNGIWKFHEIEDGASWGLLAMLEILKSGVLNG
ncbi:MAG: hypothetical protein ABFC94_05630 [Syntrophomonas sp.]